MGGQATGRGARREATSAAPTSRTAETYAMDQAEREAEGQIYEAIEENLPERARPTEWNWEDLAKFANVRLEAEPPRSGPEEGGPRRGRRVVDREGPGGDPQDRSGRRAPAPASRFRPPAVCGWVKYKFGISLDIEEIRAWSRPRSNTWSASGPKRPTTRRKSSFRSWPGCPTYTRDSSGFNATTGGAGGLGQGSLRRRPSRGGPQEQAAARESRQHADRAEPAKRRPRPRQTRGGRRRLGRGSFDGQASRRPRPSARQRPALVVLRLAQGKLPHPISPEEIGRL